jgi:cobaltochelatase CobN
MKLIVFTTSYAVLRNFSRAYAGFNVKQKREMQLALFNLEKNMEASEWDKVRQAIRQADMILHDPHGMPEEVLHMLIRECMDTEAQQVPVGGDSRQLGHLLRLGQLRGSDLPERSAAMGNAAGLPEEKRRDSAALMNIRSYWQTGGPDHTRSLLFLLARQYGGFADWPAPASLQMFAGISVYDPVAERAYESPGDIRAAQSHDPNKPTVAVLYMAGTYPVDLHPVVAGMAERIGKFANVLPLAFASIIGVDTVQLRELLMHGGSGGGAVSMIVNFIPFRLGAGPVGGDSAAVVALLEELKVPLLHPVFLSQRLQKEWRESADGLSPGEFLVQMLLPELDGAIELFPVAAMDEEVYDQELEIRWRNLTLIEERADRLADKMRHWLALQTKPRHEKKLSVICYNYPPGEANLFGGSFIDAFASVSRILSALKQAGYAVQEMSAAELQAAFTEKGLVNSGSWSPDGGASSSMLRYPYARCEEYLRRAPYAAQMEKQWGRAPGDIMTDKGDFLIPGLINGHVFIGLQPARGIHEQSEKAYHDKSALPPYQYRAFYHYIKEEFGADAILHVGTHGTLEFMAGKETGMSGDCLPDELIGAIPHLYYYYVGNPSEAMTAKRRSHAVLLSYQSPPFVESELYGEYTLLESLLHDYRQAERLNPSQCADIWSRAKRKAAELHLEADDPDDIEDEVYRMRRSLIPSGLHVLGEGYDRQEAAQYMKFVLRHDRHGIRSLASLAAELRGWDFNQLLADNRTAELQQLDDQVSGLVRRFAETGEIPELPEGAQSLRTDWINTWEFGIQAFRAASSNRELEQLIHVLDGEYTPARLSGDSIRHPDILPTGYNLYQFDCRSVPSDTAAARGAAIAENTIELYRSRCGSYPDTTALVMWGLETSRTQGETFGQILRLLGIRITGRSRFNQPIYELIPLEELGRPRLNVVVNICGFFRDMFPNLLAELNQLFRQASELDEPEEDNRFKRHTLEIYRKLTAEGIAEDEAWDLACARIFGPAAAEYGTNLTKLVETKAWKDESELGEGYLKSLRYVYSGGSRGREMESLFRSHLQAVDIVSQVRSDHEHEVTDLDHFYEFFGGLSKSVELSKGSRADIFITDTTGERVKTEDAAASIGRGLRTRLLNPKWIDALMEHPYHGVQKIAARFENMLGLAATTHKVESWMFSELHQTYVADEERSKQLERNNRWAYHQLLETMLECHQRQYWMASEEELDQLRNRYMELEEELE